MFHQRLRRPESRKFALFSLLSVLFILILACAGPKSTTTPTQAAPPTQTTLPAATSQPVPSPSPTRVTPSPLPPAPPTVSATPASTPTRTPTQTPAATPTVVPTPAPSPTAAPAPATPRLTPAPVTATPIPPPAEATLQWLGQATFILTSSRGTKVLIDPTSPGVGYAISPISGVDVVIVGHEHADHNNVSLATGTPLVLRGLSATGWNDMNQTVKDVSIRSVATYHDSQQGARRGRNTVFVFQVDGLKMVHVSDLGHILSPEQVQAIGAVDVLMIPVGGNFTIDATQATQVVQQLSPRIVIPMHYKTAATSPGLPIAPVDDFLTGKKVQRPNSNILRVSGASLPADTTVTVLNYQ